MPVSPDCHGSEYSRPESQLGPASAEMMFEAFGIASRSSFSTYPRRTIRAAIQSVRTVMSRPIDCPRFSAAWFLPNHSSLSLTSSM